MRESREHPYDKIIRRWKDDGKKMAMGKHKAANVVTCEKVITELEEAGHHEAASWCLWMLWWRWQDSITHQAIQEQLEEELSEALSA